MLGTQHSIYMKFKCMQSQWIVTEVRTEADSGKKGRGWWRGGISEVSAILVLF